MSPYDPVAIVPQSAITRGKLLRRLWYLGWALATLSLVGSAFLGGQVLAYKNTAKELENSRAEIRKFQAEQYNLSFYFAAAWQEQRNGIKLVTSWASYVKDRDDLSNFNRKNAPTDFTRSVASKGK